MKAINIFFGLLSIVILGTGLFGLFTNESLNLVLSSLALGFFSTIVFLLTSKSLKQNNF